MKVYVVDALMFEDSGVDVRLSREGAIKYCYELVDKDEDVPDLDGVSSINGHGVNQPASELIKQFLANKIDEFIIGDGDQAMVMVYQVEVLP